MMGCVLTVAMVPPCSVWTTSLTYSPSIDSLKSLKRRSHWSTDGESPPPSDRPHPSIYCHVLSGPQTDHTLHILRYGSQTDHTPPYTAMCYFRQTTPLHILPCGPQTDHTPPYTAMWSSDRPHPSIYCHVLSVLRYLEKLLEYLCGYLDRVHPLLDQVGITGFVMMS